MTDNEIIKALECCEKPVGKGCKECPLYNTDCTAINLGAIALDLINRQKAEIEKKDTEIEILIRKKHALRDEVEEKEAEIFKLKAEISKLI